MGRGRTNALDLALKQQEILDMPIK